MPRFAILIATALITLGSSACAGESGSPQAAQATTTLQKTCRADSGCPDGFCDAGLCRAVAGVFGRACKPAPRTPEGPRDGKLNFCGAYLCTEGRCRSCQSNAQCQSELGAPRCYKLEGEPGFRCGNPAHLSLPVN